MSKKDVGTPPQIDFDLAMSSRYQDTEPNHRPTTPEAMTRRSFYLPRDVVEAFAAGAARIHHATEGRVSKGEAQAAIMRRGLADLDSIITELTS